MTRVKICGITREEDASAAAYAGADALGFITYPKSPRFVRLEDVARWAQDLPPFLQRVVVAVNEPIEQVKKWAEIFPADAWQFHGDETPEYIMAAKSVLGAARIIKVFRAGPELAIDMCREFSAASFLLDTPAQGYGGAGKIFDWDIAAEFKKRCGKPVVLAGGLSPENVGAAIARVRPYAVDINSGVESSHGIKDHDKIRRVILACREADRA